MDKYYEYYFGLAGRARASRRSTIRAGGGGMTTQILGCMGYVGVIDRVRGAISGLLRILTKMNCLE